jgi:conjugative relaxase-like TrwC/TraI family protein
MIFYTPISNAKAAKDYYAQHLAPGDYYARETAELKGIWHGRGAEMLGLSGEVRQKDYFQLCDNLHPETGEQLTPRMKEDRRVLMDFTFDAPNRSRSPMN